KIYVLRSDLITAETRALLMSLASVVLVAGRGKIGAQIDSVVEKALPRVATPAKVVIATKAKAPVEELEFFNGTGGFGDQGREYVSVLSDGQTTPAPWINVIANANFGFHASAEGSGAIWAENSRENLLTPWSNDPVTDAPGTAIYLRDVESGALWTPTALPIRDQGQYVARHGFGYSRFEHETNGIKSDLVQFVPSDDAVKISHLTLTNTSDTVKTLAITGYAEWVLGTSRGATARHIITESDAKTGAIFARNPFGMAFPGRVAFADFGAATTSSSADRAAFLGPAGAMSNPAALHDEGLNGLTGPTLDPCAALQRKVTLQPGERVDLTFLIGQADSADAVRDLIMRTRAADPREVLASVKATWSALLTTVQIETPDRAMDIMLNGWLLYQTLSCRIWARAGFYQASGAYGFRDQLQDNMALTFSRPEMTREHLLRVASRQFREGDVQHWWLPHSGQGVRTHISDDRVWLGYAATLYIKSSGDEAVFDEVVPFLEGPAVPEGEHDAFYQPTISEKDASLFEHCARGLDLAIKLTGENGMPLIGTGDWNDGMNRVGEHGKGTSVWLGWLLVTTLHAMLPYADKRNPERAAKWRAHADRVSAAIERDGWDGNWYRRGTYDDGTILGTASAEECRIDSIAQSWAVLSGAAPIDRAKQAMQSLNNELVRRDPGLALLFTPPFDSGPHDPGYIKGYPPGLRENGGQYSHAAMWAILAHAKLGDGDAAGDLFALINPVNHALSASEANRYKVEPYVVAADVYSTGSLEGRGGWTWYTGSAGWMYRAGIEGLMGLTREGDSLRLAPCFPKAWPDVRLRITLDGTTFDIHVRNISGTGHGVSSA
ncbi:MAG: glycosyl transferase, partial [Deltaproteobacteria bacterium]